MHRQLIGAPFAHDRPGDACCFVGHGDCDDLGRLLCQQLYDPGILLRMKSGLAHDGCRSDNKQPPEVAVSLLGYTAELLLASCRMLSRNEADPGCEIATATSGSKACWMSSGLAHSSAARRGFGIGQRSRVLVL